MPCTHATLGGQVEKEKKRTETETDKKEGTSPQLFPSAVSRSSCTRLGLEWERPACQPAQQALLCVHRLQPSGKPFSFGYSGQHAACAGSSHFGDDFNLDLRERERDENNGRTQPTTSQHSRRSFRFLHACHSAHLHHYRRRSRGRSRSTRARGGPCALYLVGTCMFGRSSSVLLPVTVVRCLPRSLMWIDRRPR